MQQWRCRNEDCSDQAHAVLHGHDFLADLPVCDKCGADARKPEGQEVIEKINPVHLLVKDPTGPIYGMKGSRWKVMCDGSLRLGKIMASGEPSATTCLNCKDHRDFPQVYDEMTESLVPDWRVGRDIKPLG